MELKSLQSAFHTPSDASLNAQIADLQADMANNPSDRSVDEEIIAADQLIEKDGTSILSNPVDLAELNDLDAEVAEARKNSPNLPVWGELRA